MLNLKIHSSSSFHLYWSIQKQQLEWKVLFTSLLFYTSFFTNTVDMDDKFVVLIKAHSGFVELVRHCLTLSHYPCFKANYVISQKIASSVSPVELNITIKWLVCLFKVSCIWNIWPLVKYEYLKMLIYCYFSEIVKKHLPFIWIFSQYIGLPPVYFCFLPTWVLCIYGYN